MNAAHSNGWIAWTLEGGSCRLQEPCATMSGTLGFGTFGCLQSTQLRPPTSHCSASSMSTESFEPEQRIVRPDARGARGESRWRRASITNRESWRSSFARVRHAAPSASAATSTNGRILRARRGLRRRLPPAARSRQADSGSPRAAVPVPRRGHEALSGRLRKAAAARLDDRAPERRPSSDTRADRRVAHTRKQRLELPMSFLDRFKPQPKWKHADPTVRAAAVAELVTTIPSNNARSSSSRERTRTCGSARGCRARRRRSSDLVQLAATERDEELRRELTDRLVGDRDGAVGFGRRRRTGARRRSTDQKQLATVAKSSPHETVRAAALGRVHDVQTLSSVARHAADPQTALEAVARVPDPRGAPQHRPEDRSQGRRRRRARAH